MIDYRQKIFNTISRALAITRYDIENRQIINDQSLNIHGENYFRDLLNDLYGLNLKNANFETSNHPCIDLIDTESKIAIQITTTRTLEKIKKTYEILDKKDFENYEVKIFYLLDKANPTDTSLSAINKKYSIKLEQLLLDCSDLIKKINDLDTDAMASICRKFFEKVSESYTDHMELDLTIKHLLKQYATNSKNYDDNFGSLDIKEKFVLNSINERLAASITFGLDYRHIVDELDGDIVITRLREFVIDNLYKNILVELLSAKNTKESLPKTVSELHNFAAAQEIDFNKAISNLKIKLITQIGIDGAHTNHCIWVIIGYFFELCDIGMHRK